MKKSILYAPNKGSSPFYSSCSCVTFTLLSIILSLLLSSASWGKEVFVDGTGDDGQHASDGVSYSTSARRGCRSKGRAGGAAGESTKGEHGKNVNVLLKDLGDSRQAVLQVMAEIEDRSGLNTKVELGANTRVRVDTSGGTGGNGGVGGDGEGGCYGDGGDDADAKTPGEDGGPGTNGGSNGPGSRGSRGGDAGDAVVSMLPKDVHLSLIVDCKAIAGTGGNPGEDGDPGDLGPGGSGGSSYSNTEYVKTGKQICPKPVVVSKSDGSNTVTQGACKDEVKPVTTSQPGGSNGPNGKRGTRVQGDTKGGDDGKDGVCILQTEFEGKVYRASRPFHAQVVSYRLVDDNRDGIFEPLEKIHVYDLVVKNIGELPTPGGRAELRIALPSRTNYTSAESKYVVLPQIAPTKQHMFKGEVLTFTINDNKSIGLNERLTFVDDVSLNNRITRIERSQDNFNNKANRHRRVVITYPIEISSFVTKTSVGAGESIPILWKVKNISKKDFGGIEGMKRSIRTALSKIGGSASHSTMKFVGPNGDETLFSDVFWQEILNLKSGQEVVIEGALEVSELALAYTDFEVGADLYFQNLRGNSQHIQRNTVNIRIAQLFSYTPEAEYLLITNQRTEREEYTAWLKMASDMGVKMDVWDVSYYGGWSLRQALEELDGKSFMQVLANKTILALNQRDYVTESGLVPMNQIAELLAKRKANFVLLGGDRQLLSEFYTRALTQPYYNASGQALIGERQEILVDETPSWMFWTDGNREDFRATIQERVEKEMANDPHGHFFVLADYSPRIGAKHRTLGRVEYVRTLTPGGGRMAALPVDVGLLQSSDFISSEEMLRAISLPTSFQYKLSVLNNHKQKRMKRVMQDAVLYDLILEVDLYDRACSLGSCIEQIGPRFNSYFEILSGLDLSSEHAHIVAGLLIYMDLVGESATRKKLELQLAQYSKNEAVRDVKSRMEDKLELRADRLVGIDERDNARNMLTLPAVHNLITTDTLLRDGYLIQGGQ